MGPGTIARVAWAHKPREHYEQDVDNELIGHIRYEMPPSVEW